MLRLFLLDNRALKQLIGACTFFFFLKNYVYVKVIKVGKGLEWGVKAIIWEEKKNDLSSSCQQRKRLCINKKKGARQRQRCGHLSELLTVTLTQLIWDLLSMANCEWTVCSCISEPLTEKRAGKERIAER